MKQVMLMVLIGLCGCRTQPQPMEKKAPVEVPTTNATIIGDCDAGAAGSCLMLGLRYERGENVNPDIDKAFEYYERACQLGSSHGCYSKALVLLEERNNPIQALSFFEYGCDQQKHGPSCVALGDFAREGTIFPSDEAEALRRYGQACSTGYHVGCNAYIRHLWTASKQLVSLDEFVSFLSSNCRAGHEMSCREAADLYTTGAQWSGEKLGKDLAKADEYRSKLAQARRSRVVVDAQSTPPPADLAVREVAPKAPAEPFTPGYIVVAGRDGDRIFVDGVDTGKASPSTITIVVGGRHSVQLQSKGGELSSAKLTWIDSGGRVELTF